MSRRSVEWICGGLALLVAIALLAVGAGRSYKAYDAKSEEFGLVAFTKIGERDMVVDATFGGLERKGDKLYSTYDRTAPRGKRACPT